jgi:glucose/arabinose dehydrogenase
MHCRQAVATTFLVAAGLVLTATACLPNVGSLAPAEPAPADSAAVAGTPTAEDTTVAADTEMTDTVTTVADDAASAPEQLETMGPPGAPADSVVPSPSPVAAAASTPTAQPLTEVVAIALAKDNRIALIDPVTSKVARMIDLSRPTGKLTLEADGHSAWVFGAQPDQASIGVLDVLTGNRREDVQFRKGDGPVAAAFSSDGSRAYVAMDGGLSAPQGPGPSAIAFTSIAGHEFGRVTVGRQTPGVQIRRQLSSLAVTPGQNGDVLLAAGQQSGVVWALDGGSGAVLNEIEVGGGPTSIVTDPTSQRAYVLLDTLNQVVAIDTSTLAVTGRLDLPARPIGAAVSSDGTLFIAGGDASGEVWVVEPGASAIRFRVPIGGRPVGLALSSDGTAVYVPDSETRSLQILSADTIQVERTIPLASEPLSVVAVRGSTQHQALAPTPTVAGRPSPSPTPSLVPTATPLPQGARPLEHLPADAVSEPFVSGADLPVALAFAPDGRLFYNELHTGKIRVVQNGALLPDPFYQFVIADQPESGMLGLTLDPNFQGNHYVYVFYTSVPVEGATTGLNQVVRLTDVGNKGIDPTPILQDLPSGNVHNSGALRFGPDGKLYLAIGDDDRGSHAQDLNTLAGKILRVNPDGSSPGDNPFAGDTGKQDAIWAYGLRNASSFAFHPVGHELLAVEDGAGNNDALELIVRGGNYGWPQAGYRFKPGIDDPIAVMNPVIVPTGSTFYTGDQLPEWKNDWFYCSYNQGQLRRVHLAPASFDRVVFEELVKQGCSYDVATGPDGALYYSDAKGIYRIRSRDQANN